MRSTATPRWSRVLVFANWLASFAAVFALSAWPAQAVGVEPARSKVLIWIDSPSDRALVERVRGQVSDLDVDLLPVEAAPAASVEGSVVLIWFTRPDPSVDQVLIHGRRGDQERAWVRQIGDGGPAVGGELSSPTLEAAALVVREAVRDMARTEPPVAEPREEGKVARPLPPLTPPSVLPKPEPARLSFRAELDWRVLLDGAGALERQGPELLLGAVYRRFELSLFAGSSLPATERDRYGNVRLLRQTLGARAGKEWALTSRFAFDLALRAGAVRYARHAAELSPNVTPNADRASASALFGPELRLGWAPGGGPFELLATAGADVVPGAPRIGYEVDGRFEPSFLIWRLQPAFGIGAAFRSERRR